MALKPCPECGRSVSTEATFCPHCGKKNPTGAKTSPLTMGCLVVIILAVIISIVQSTSQDAPKVPREPVTQSTRPSAPTTSTGNVAEDQLLQVSEERRHEAFALTVKQNGGTCLFVTRSFFQGMSAQHNAFWSFNCDGKTDWQVMITPDAEGTTYLLACSVLRAVNGGDCWKKL